MVRKVDATAPAPPKAETRVNPSEEQPAQALESIPKDEPDRSEPRIFNPEFLKRYTFMLATAPSRIEVMLERMNPTNASAGR